MNRKLLQTLTYLSFDFLATYVVWLIFVYFRRETLEQAGRLEPQQFINAAIVSLAWIGLYAIAGLYKKPFRRSRMEEIIQLFKYSLVGVLILFFSIFLDDPIPPENPSLQRTLLTIYMGLQFGAVAVIRFIITTRTNVRIRKRAFGFPTLLVGGGEQAYKIYEELEQNPRSLGYQFKGFVSMPESADHRFRGKLKHFGTTNRIEEIIRTRKIEEVILALEPEELKKVPELIERCEPYQVNIKVVPRVYDYIVGSVKSSHILGAPLVEVYPQIMRPWEAFAKRLFDILASGFALLLLTPLYCVLAILIKTGSEGPIFFKQERIGRGGIPFKIIKFRSMYIDAEKFGPALSSDHDPRITRVGKWLRKLRLDELPQFWNVLIGEMSIVGPRPERQFFIDQIVAVAPQYQHLHKVRPGITSWGQVKYGYASSVDEMVERLNFDILYLENMSLALDIKILLYTVIVIIEGRGK
ncbi:sugar transferase [Pontibacter sp. G13]|uniref:sugar transferase n=1 Tax=Pontibacter sp. G13 TaxID=3074898 RepID=UPI00288A0411|nr:sugar transferase [Pontibacter sp. G13]WNJ18068.1 sugar transferase [Pontibacter sp. G13]